mgnify:CR=1 FL=1
MKITVISLFRDSEPDIHNCLSRLEDLERNTDAEFEYSFYENDSVDNTREILKKWIEGRDGFLTFEDLNAPKFSNTASDQRNYLMTDYRNKSLNAIKPIDSDFSIVFDSDVIFDENIVNLFFSYMEDDIAMVTPNVLQNINCKMFDSQKKSYYDSYALIDKDMNNGMTWASNPFYRKEDRENWDNGKPVEVFSAFGGFIMLRSKILNKVQWYTEGHCEHWSLCSQVGKFGKILVIPRIITEVYHSRAIIDSISDENINRVVEFQKNKLNDKYFSK